MIGVSAQGKKRRGKGIPSWGIVLAVLVTAVATGFLATSQRPETWPDTVGQMPRQMTEATSPGLGVPDPFRSAPTQQVTPVQPAFGVPAQQLIPLQPQFGAPVAGNQGSFQRVAMAGVPAIGWGIPRPHGDRGACTPCHKVLLPNGVPVPTIRSDDVMPHPYRGMCINCHTTTPAIGFTGMGTRVAAIGQLPVGQAPMGLAPPKKEADWMGMEVAPITPITAQQFEIAPGIAGVVVTDVEEQAKAAGMKPGDIVVAIEGQPVNNMLGFLAARQGKKQGGTVQLMRRGKFMEANVRRIRAVQRMATDPGGQNMMATTPTPLGNQRLVAPAPTPIQQGPVRIGLQQLPAPAPMDRPMGEQR